MNPTRKQLARIFIAGLVIAIIVFIAIGFEYGYELWRMTVAVIIGSIIMMWLKPY